jgi:hypothetical protein
MLQKGEGQARPGIGFQVRGYAALIIGGLADRHLGIDTNTKEPRSSAVSDAKAGPVRYRYISLVCFGGAGWLQMVVRK